jgi:hypothetical protein
MTTHGIGVEKQFRCESVWRRRWARGDEKPEEVVVVKDEWHEDAMLMRNDGEDVVYLDYIMIRTKDGEGRRVMPALRTRYPLLRPGDELVIRREEE